MIKMSQNVDDIQYWICGYGFTVQNPLKDTQLSDWIRMIL